MGINKHYLQIHLAVLLFGGAGLFGKLIQMSSGGIVLGRAFWGAFFILLIKNSFNVSFKPKTTKDLFVFCLLGVILAFHWVAFFESIQLSSVAIGVLTFSTFPIFTSLLEPFVDKEKIKLNNLILSAITFVGVALVLPSFDIQDEYTQGALWGVASGASFAVLALISKHMIKNYSANTVSFYQNSVASMILMPFFIVDVIVGSYQDWLYLIVLGVIFTAIEHTLFNHSMKGMKAQTASLITCLEPLYAILLAWILLNEVPTFRMFIGGLIILTVTIYVTMNSEAN